MELMSSHQEYTATVTADNHGILQCSMYIHELKDKSSLSHGHLYMGNAQATNSYQFV